MANLSLIHICICTLAQIALNLCVDKPDDYQQLVAESGRMLYLDLARQRPEGCLLYTSLRAFDTPDASGVVDRPRGNPFAIRTKDKRLNLRFVAFEAHGLPCAIGVPDANG